MMEPTIAVHVSVLSNAPVPSIHKTHSLALNLKINSSFLTQATINCEFGCVGD